MRTLIPIVALCSLGFSSHAPTQLLPPVPMKEESLTIEYTASAGEAAFVVKAESEIPLAGVEVKGPDGDALMRLRSREGKDLDANGMMGFVIESKETTLEELLRSYPEGQYSFRAQSRDGRLVQGSALFLHALPPAPVVTFPAPGMTDLPPAGFVITWDPVPGAVEYLVVLERDENDGLTARLSPDQTSFRVPPGILTPETESHVEIGVVGPSGNCTLVEVPFTTR